MGIYLAQWAQTHSQSMIHADRQDLDLTQLTPSEDLVKRSLEITETLWVSISLDSQLEKVVVDIIQANSYETCAHNDHNWLTITSFNYNSFFPLIYVDCYVFFAFISIKFIFYLFIFNRIL